MSDEEFRAKLNEVRPDVNIDKGLTVCGDMMEFYQEILQVLIDSAAEQMSNLKAYLEAKDYQNYIVLAHGMKGQCYNVGADELGDYAKTFEFAGKESRYDYLEENTDDFLGKYDKFINDIRGVLALL